MRSILACFILCSALAFAEARAEPSAEMIAHGKALTIAADCASCHTANPARPFAGGVKIDTPFGALYSANLTPDQNITPEAELRFPFNFRILMRAWNYLFLRPGFLEPDQQKGADWNRGR